MKGDYYRYLAEFATGNDRKDSPQNSFFAYKTSSDDGVTWDTEVIVSTSLGDGNIIYDELSNRINGITNIWNGDQYTPYMYRAPYRGHNDSASGGSAGGGSYVHHIVSDGGGFVSRGTGSGCPSCGSLSWRSLVLDPKHPQGKRIHPGPQAAGNPLENDDPEGRGPHYFKCAQCGYIINTDNIQQETVWSWTVREIKQLTIQLKD